MIARSRKRMIVRTSSILATAMLGVLCGCAESQHEKAMDKQIADLQASCNSLSNSIVSVREKEGVLLNLVPDSTAVGKIVRQTNDWPTYAGPSFINPATVQPTDIDPDTGLPYKQSLVVFPAKGRVTAVSDQGWNWAVWFAIGNPNGLPQTWNASINFLDAGGRVIHSAMDYDLHILADSTNFFVATTIISQPAAKNVKSVRVYLNSFIEQ